LALQAIDAAKKAGAQYAEARLTRTVSELINEVGLAQDNEDLGIGVRALVNGAWGFAASPYWDLDEAAQLARDAVAQATINARVSSHDVDFGSYPVATGSWMTPVRIDPFAISIEEKRDFIVSLRGLIPRHVRGRFYNGKILSIGFKRQERAVATTEGAYFTQTQYQAVGSFFITVTDTSHGMPYTTRTVYGKGLGKAAAGWERIVEAKLPEQIPSLVEEVTALLEVPTKPVEVGRYDVVCDAQTMGSFVDQTLGEATELDRTLGYEANAGGTSYLGPAPLKNLGTSLGSSLLNVRGNRSIPLGLATVKWDDEGVEPDDFPLIQNGVLVDYQTTREQAPWLKTWYEQQNRPIRSHGCAVAASALATPLEATPNLVLAAGTDDIGFTDLVANTKRGVALTQGSADMDFQFLSGAEAGSMREISNGRLGAFIVGGGFLFNSRELWKNLIALGGPNSRDMVPAVERKGEPAQIFEHSVSTVPGTFKNIALIDLRRKA
jgi:TldD protein